MPKFDEGGLPSQQGDKFCLFVFGEAARGVLERCFPVCEGFQRRGRVVIDFRGLGRASQDGECLWDTTGVGSAEGNWHIPQALQGSRELRMVHSAGRHRIYMGYNFAHECVTVAGCSRPSLNRDDSVWGLWRWYACTQYTQPTPKKCVCTHIRRTPLGVVCADGWRKGGGDAWMGAQKCVTVKIFVPHKKNQKKCSDSWQRRGGV